ncbi:hypothetical protein NL676_018468 [Syzygium grande]|nr:hypothetical protein NL676_018468 [Syzygium grande]
MRPMGLEGGTSLVKLGQLKVKRCWGIGLKNVATRWQGVFRSNNVASIASSGVVCLMMCLQLNGAQGGHEPSEVGPVEGKEVLGG